MFEPDPYRKVGVQQIAPGMKRAVASLEAAGNATGAQLTASGPRAMDVCVTTADRIHENITEYFAHGYAWSGAPATLSQA